MSRDSSIAPRSAFARSLAAPFALPFALPLALLALAVPARAEIESQARRTLNADGSVSLTYSTPVDELGTVFGLDLSRGATSAAPAVGTASGDIGGTAYAKVLLSRLPDWMVWEKGAVNVSVDPNDARSKVATTFSRSVTLTDGLAATLADTYQLASGSDAWETGKSVSLHVTDTGTTVSLAAKASSETSAFLPTLSAQQKLAGGVSVTTSVSDTGSSLNRSITAGFSHRW